MKVDLIITPQPSLNGAEYGRGRKATYCPKPRAKRRGL